MMTNPQTSFFPPRTSNTSNKGMLCKPTASAGCLPSAFSGGLDPYPCWLLAHRETCGKTRGFGFLVFFRIPNSDGNFGPIQGFCQKKNLQILVKPPNFSNRCVKQPCLRTPCLMWESGKFLLVRHMEHFQPITCFAHSANWGQIFWASSDNTHTKSRSIVKPRLFPHPSPSILGQWQRWVDSPRVAAFVEWDVQEIWNTWHHVGHPTVESNGGARGDHKHSRFS